MNDKKIVPVFFACDNGFVKYTTVAIKSLITNASRECKYHIHILHTGIEQDKMDIVMDMADDVFVISFDDVSEYMAKVKGNLPLRDYYSVSTYYRLFMADMYPEYDKAIYLDSDTIILKDISKLYDYELGDNLVAAAPDQVIVQHETFGEYAEQVVGVERNRYFNAGVILFNCKAFREENIYEQFNELVEKYTFVVAQDQDYLNVLADGRTLILPQKWNNEVFGRMLCKEEDICIIHYNFGIKPWKNKGGQLASYFWEYARKTPVYQEICQVCSEFTSEDEERELMVGKRLVQTAINEIARDDRYANMEKKNANLSQDRRQILDKISALEREGRFDEDVEEDPPSYELKPEDIEYINPDLSQRLRTKGAFRVARMFLNKMIKKKQFIVRDVIGVENFDALDSGAVITCNHFNALDSFAMQIAYERSKHRGKRTLYRVIKEGNYTNFTGFYGYLMRNCNTLPLSSNKETMKKFMKAVDYLLKKGNFVLIYPEQSMWWNYRKPKPLKRGAFTFAARSGVPVLPCFITMRDSDTVDADGFFVQEYTIHVGEAIYPDPNKSQRDNVDYMIEKNYQVWKEVYERVYNIPLTYTCRKKED